MAAPGILCPAHRRCLMSPPLLRDKTPVAFASTYTRRRTRLSCALSALHAAGYGEQSPTERPPGVTALESLMEPVKGSSPAHLSLLEPEARWVGGAPDTPRPK